MAGPPPQVLERVARDADMRRVREAAIELRDLMEEFNLTYGHIGFSFEVQMLILAIRVLAIPQ